MTPRKFIAILKKTDPDLLLSHSERSGKWVVQKLVPTCVYAHPNPANLPKEGACVVREFRKIPRTMFSLPWGLTERSLTHARRNMFWKRGISADIVADAMDKEDRLLHDSKARERVNYHEAFNADYGKQIRKKIMGEPTIQAGINLCQ